MFRAQLAEGTAPVSEGDFEDHLLADGAPVAIIDIPALGIHEVVVEGTTSGELALGPGHRRDTVLPGQQGVSVIYGRAASYGGPFARLQQLPLDSEIRVRTGQGEHVYRVLGVRYAGEATPPPLAAGEGRLVLVSARGLPYMPTGAIFVDAQLESEVQDRGARFTTFGTLPPEAKPFASDTSTVWALIFALQFLIAAELALLWLLPRVGSRRAWIVFFPVMLLGGLWAGYQINLLLPNLL
jgi:LPXTG-site transpeptidase (sortase) family protein